jgi:hypothetical protein
MELKNLIDITPEIEIEATNLLKASQRLKKLIGDKGHFDMSTYNASRDHITIYDRHEYSRDGLGTDLGFFVHRIYEDGSVALDFINENNEEGIAFDKAFNEYMEEGQDGEN